MIADVRRVAERQMFTAAAGALEPRPSVARSQWCAEHLYLPAETSATPGPYDLDRYAYLRDVLDAVDDPEVEQIVLCWATQLGKTTLLQAVLASQAMLSPVPAMLGSADKDSLVELRDKFYALAEASPTVAPTLPDVRLRNNRWVDVGGLRCHLAYSYNTQRMSGKSCALVLNTELDRWRKTLTHGDPFKIISQRVKAFHRFKIISESTPSNEESRIVRLYEQSDQRRFLIPCPRCGHWQELRFFRWRKGPYKDRGGVGGLTDEKGNMLSPDEALQTAHYICERGCRFESHEKTDAVRQGLWIPKGQRVDRETGEIQGTPQRSRRIWGARLSSLYAETVTFGRAAAEWLLSRDSLPELQVFYNDWLALRWRRKAKTLKWRELWRRLRGVFQPGTVPPWAYFLTAGVDIGKGYARYVVRAWGEGGQSALVEWGTTRRPPESRAGHLEALTSEILQRRWHLPPTMPSPTGATSMLVTMMGIDCGYKPHLVHDYWLGLGATRKRVRQLRGVAELKGGERWRARVVERSARDGKPYEGGQTRWEVSRAHFNADLHDRWKLSAETPGAWLLTDAPLDVCENYLRELTNEAPVQKRNKLGRSTTVWEVVDQNIGNHFFDAEAYAAACADMVVGGDWHGLERKAGKPKKPPGERPSPYVARDDQEGFSAR